jgi:parallel beta-helix repeat protein
MLKRNAYLKKSIIIHSMFLLLVISITSSSGLIYEKEYERFNPYGNTIYVGGSGQGNFSNIQDAIDFAKNGDIIFVFDDSSPYFENIKINKSISLIGENRHSTIIDGKELGNVVEISANNIDISRFTIQNCSKGSSAGIRGSTNFSSITNNNIEFNNWSGLVLKYSQFNIISDNNINSNRWLGLFLGTCNNNEISKNRIVSNINEGFIQFDSHNNKITENFIAKNEYGIFISRYCKNNTISGNIITCNEYGICFHESYGNNTIKNNAVRMNMYGISMEYSYLNNIINNNFGRNAFNAHFETFTQDENSTNYWNGNYWNRPRILPKLIWGTEWTGWGFNSIINLEIDRNPSLLPNKIGG